MRTHSFNKFTSLVLLLVGAGSGTRASAQEASVDASFLSAVEWRFVGPYRGGRVDAVAGVWDDPHVFYAGAAHGIGGTCRTASSNSRRWVPWTCPSRIRT